MGVGRNRVPSPEDRVGVKSVLDDIRAMSGLPLQADLRASSPLDRKVPTGDIKQRASGRPRRLLNATKGEVGQEARVYATPARRITASDFTRISRATS